MALRHERAAASYGAEPSHGADEAPCEGGAGAIETARAMQANIRPGTVLVAGCRSIAARLKDDVTANATWDSSSRLRDSLEVLS